jgi:hypothetical protein
MLDAYKTLVSEIVASSIWTLDYSSTLSRLLFLGPILRQEKVVIAIEIYLRVKQAYLWAQRWWYISIEYLSSPICLGVD